MHNHVKSASTVQYSASPPVARTGSGWNAACPAPFPLRFALRRGSPACGLRPIPGLIQFSSRFLPAARLSVAELLRRISVRPELQVHLGQLGLEVFGMRV